MPTPTPEVEEIKWTEETKVISEAWWNYWNYQGTPDRDFIEKWWLQKISSLTQKHKEEIEKAREEERERIADVLWRYGLIRGKDDVASYCTRPHPHQNR